MSRRELQAGADRADVRLLDFEPDRVRSRANVAGIASLGRVLATLSATAILAVIAAVPAQAATFGLKEVDLGLSGNPGVPPLQAGEHPLDLHTTIAVETEEREPYDFEVPVEDTKDVTITNFEGLVAAPEATQRCENVDFLSPGEPKCPIATTIGVNDVTVENPAKIERVRVYNIVPPPGVLLKIGFSVLQVPISVEIRLSESPPYRGIATVRGIAQLIPFYRSELTLWGTPGDPVHDAERGGEAESEAPLLTSPRACTGPLTTLFKANSWQHPGVFDEELSSPLSFTGCAKLGFGATIASQPTSQAAQSPSGLDFSLDVKDEGLLNPKGEAHSDVRKAVVTLPEGMTANPSLAEGLEACSEEQLDTEKAVPVPGEGCPQASKIGTVEVESPLIKQTLTGSLFVAEPYENPFGSLIALYLVVKNADLGVVVKQALKVEPDPKTGQLKTIAEDIPQLPFSHLRLHLREGARSPLISPRSCGTHAVKAVLTPWSGGAAIEPSASFETLTGPGGGLCPLGAPPFNPGFSAGTLNNDAGSFSPVNMRITRKDGDQDITRFSSTLPPGLLAKLAGLAKCSDAAITAAKARTGPHGGAEELANPSCPADSKIGRTLAGAGVGSQLIYVPGSLYLAGPFGGDPLSVVAIVPALAGPFDAGTVVVRVALTVNPKTAQAEVDGSASDPIPHILRGIPLNVRDLRVYVDRPDFTLNPTSCDPFAAQASISGSGLLPLDPADDSPVSLSDRFQAANCAALGFKPKLSLRLKGGTKRGDHPAVRAVVIPRAGDANFGQAVVTLPRSAFLDQAHIRTICTRVQFAAKACPPGAIYGKAKAWSPLLDEPAEGPVYLRSSNHNLPDLVMALHGPPSAPVDVELVGRVDSHKGGIRTSFESIPDVPVTRFILEMQGGAKGLIVNSRELCARPSKATAKLTGQNNRRHNFNPVVKAAGCQGSKGAKRRQRR
jgi:hypothetical protein